MTVQQMDLQPSLFDGDPPTVVECSVAGSIQERFENFHRANSWVFTAIERLVAQYAATGRERIGIRMIWEVIRWSYAMRTTDPTSEFRTNDHYHSRYVRLLIERHPEWEHLFELRRLRA